MHRMPRVHQKSRPSRDGRLGTDVSGFDACATCMETLKDSMKAMSCGMGTFVPSLSDTQLAWAGLVKHAKLSLSPGDATTSVIA